MSNLVGNPEDRFSRDALVIQLILLKRMPSFERRESEPKQSIKSAKQNSYFLNFFLLVNFVTHHILQFATSQLQHFAQVY